MKWSTEERQAFLTRLDGVQRVVVAFYRLLLIIVVAVVLAGVVFVIARKPWGAGTQGEWFYFSIAVLLILGWVTGQFVALGRRQRPGQPAVTFQASSDGVARTWNFRFGSAAPDSHESPSPSENSVQYRFSQSFVIPLGTLPAEALPDEAMAASGKTEP